jgi:NADH-quinone oxidoreductase subunit J
MVELLVFAVAAACCLAGALGVVLSSNPVHAALSLVGTLFGIAVLFVAQEASFLAAVQVIVYAGAIVVLFLFVLMLLGVDRAEDLTIEPIGGQRIAALVIAVCIVALPVMAMSNTDFKATGARPSEVVLDPATGQVAGGSSSRIDASKPDIEQLGESLFTDYLFAFEITSVLLVIAVVGAVVMARRVRRSTWIDDPLVEAHLAEVAAAEGQPAADTVTAAEPEGDT